MNLANGKLLFLLLILLPLVALLIILPKRYKKRFGEFADPEFWNYYFRDWSFFWFRLKTVLLLAALAFIILALVRPQWDTEKQDIRRSGLDIAICLDASKSMDATDIIPSRLQRAKDQIAAFIDEQKGDRIALIPFAGTAFVQCPLTDDYEAVKLLLSSLSTNSIPVWGTDIGRALRTAASVFDQKAKTKVVILISDGEDLSNDAVQAARELARHGIIVYTMGVGTPEGGKVKMNTDEDLRSSTPLEVTTRLDNKTMEKIASVTGGQFYMITPTQDEIAAILKHISSLERSRFSSLKLNLYKEQYHLFALAALLLLLAETLLGVRTGKNENGRNGKPAAVALLLMLFLPCFNLQAVKMPWSKYYADSKGNSAYQKQDFQKAEEIFNRNAADHPKDPVLQYNHGNSLYKLQQNEKAAQAWQKAMSSSDPKLQSKIWHNLGNLQFQAKNYKEAMESYRKAVLADPNNVNAKVNYDLAKRMLQNQQRQQKNQQGNRQQQQNQQQQTPQQITQREEAERILKALEQKEINDRLSRQGSPQRMRDNKWW